MKQKLKRGMKVKKEVMVNSCFYPNPVVLVSSEYESKESIITLAWAGTCCSDPPMVSVGIRPERYSYELIKESKEFVINFPVARMLKQVEFCGMKSGKTSDKWEECNFTKVKSKIVGAPRISECPVNMECKVEQIITLGTHDLFIAKAVALHIDETWKDKNYPEMLTYTRGKYGKVKVL
jgi:flavin reductase (DIM6/NTAB) family NADH-FMN oxidoreductase RutF